MPAEWRDDLHYISLDIVNLVAGGKSKKLPAQVPGDHYSDLLRAGKIPDPYYQDNNTAVQWAAKTGWTYQRTFEATSEQLAMEHVELVCHGMHTWGTWHNQKYVATWIFDARRALKPGSNAKKGFCISRGYSDVVTWDCRLNSMSSRAAFA